MKAPDELRACQFAVTKHIGDCSGATKRDPFAIAKCLNIEIVRKAGLPYEGMIERDVNGKAHILLRSSLNRTRERFTVAHELGHWVLQEEMVGSMRGQLFRGVSRDEKEMAQEERLANLMAAEILMPYEPMRDRFDSSNQLRSLEEICRTFGVSRTAAIRRIADVCDKHFVFLQVVPFRFNDLSSSAEIDDAIFASTKQSTLFDRDRTRFAPRIPFEQIIAFKKVRISLNSPKGIIATEFDSTYQTTPIPHAFLLASVDNWNS